MNASAVTLAIWFAARSAARISHFEAMIVFALFVAIALGGVAPQQSAAGRIKYAARSFFLFVAIAIGIAWLMYPLSR